jgi:hypothetical protein
LEKPFIDKKKRNGGGGMAQGVGPEFKPQNCKRKKKKKNYTIWQVGVDQAFC